MNCAMATAHTPMHCNIPGAVLTQDSLFHFSPSLLRLVHFSAWLLPLMPHNYTHTHKTSRCRVSEWVSGWVGEWVSG